MVSPVQVPRRSGFLGSKLVSAYAVTQANTARPCTLRLRLLGVIWWNCSSGEAAECPSAARSGLRVLALPSWAPQAWTQKRLQPGSRRRPLGGGPWRAPGAGPGSAQLCLQTGFSSLSIPHACFSSTDPLSIPRRGTRGPASGLVVAAGVPRRGTRGPAAGLTTAAGALVYPVLITARSQKHQLWGRTLPGVLWEGPVVTGGAPVRPAVPVAAPGPGFFRAAVSRPAPEPRGWTQLAWTPASGDKMQP